MEFVAPAMLLGALGAAIPVAIHLIGRRRAPVVRFAALDFLLGSDRKMARKLRLRELLLLLSRVLVCVAIPLALAKPFAACRADGPRVDRGQQAAVIVIDDSLLSAYRLGHTTVLSRAQREARALVSAMGPEAQVAIALAADGSVAPQALVRDPIRTREAIDAIRTALRPRDLDAAVDRAARLLAGSAQARRRIYVIAAQAALRPLVPRGSGPPPLVALIDPAAGAPLDNTTVLDVKIDPDPDAGSRGLQVTVDVANFGRAAVDDREIKLAIDGREVATGLVSLRPGERATKRFAAVVAGRSRLFDVTVTLAPDALPMDNRRHVRAQLREEVRLLLVNGDPRTVRHEDELFYLETALRPGDRGDSGVALRSVTVEDLRSVELEEIDAVLLANVRPLEPDEVARLVAWVRRGGGLMVAVGDHLDAAAYDARMGPLLAQELRDPIDAAHGVSGVEARGRAFRLAKLDVSHPILSGFGGAEQGFGEARFSRIALLGPTTRVEGRRVLARYTNGAVALVEGRLGDGRLLLFTSTLDRDWNDLAIQPGYLPLIQRAVRYLARKPEGTQRPEELVGHARAVAIGPHAERVEIAAPGGTTVVEGERLRGRTQLIFTATDAPGLYRVAVAGRDGRPVPRPELNFAVNIDPRASDLRAAADAGAHPGAAPSASVTRQAADAEGSVAHERRVELWHAVAAGLLLLLLAEAILTLRT